MTRTIITTTNNVQKKRTHSFKVRIVALILCVITAISVIGISTTTASAAAPTPKEIISDTVDFAVNKVIDTFAGNGAIGDILKKGAGYLLGWAFSEKEEKKPTIKDALDKLDTLSEKISGYHADEMARLKSINSNIDTKDFRIQADRLGDDFREVGNVLRDNEDNILSNGKGIIDATTYKTYKAILATPDIKLSKLRKNFNAMEKYVLGERFATNKQEGFKLLTDYIVNKVNDRTKTYDFAKVPDFSQVLTSINGELKSIESTCYMDYITMLTLNSMAYKVREYEIKKGIYKIEKKEKPYASIVKAAANLTASMKRIRDNYNKIIESNKTNVVKAIVTVDGVKKGFNSFYEAWACAMKAPGKKVAIECFENMTADKTKGFNFNGLKKEFGFNTTGGFYVPRDKDVTLDLKGHTLDAVAKKDMNDIDLDTNASIHILNGKIIGGNSAIHTPGTSNVKVTLDKVTISDQSKAGVFFAHDNTQDKGIIGMSLVMNNCTVSNCKGSAISLKPTSTKYTIKNCTFENNKGYYGGAIYDNSSQWTYNYTNVIENCVFKNNHSDVAGGALCTYSTKVKSCKFEGNSAEDSGGAIFGAGTGRLSIKDCEFTGNNSKKMGGGVYLPPMTGADGATHIKGSTFTNNTAANGGALYCRGYGEYGNKLLLEWGNKGTGNSGATDKNWGFTGSYYH